ncbi:baseplate assembly protein [Algicola sagamiensis]|uniref:baseplate assembly protein n=1 Tax=Algicola sagamiensis TaxID=163869 RepID=UPI00036C323D|nr:baseplate J/gp47 family protein [Algicola sagamiensis]
MSYTPIQLDQLPPPDVVETLDYEQIVNAMVTQLQDNAPELDGVNVLSDPIRKTIEVLAYRELLLRQRINDAAQSVMLAHAKGNDLENLGALFGVARHEGELDVDYRARIQLSPEGYSTAGPIGGYIYHATSASSRVKDVSVLSPSPGVVHVYVLSNEGDGTVDDELRHLVELGLSDEDIRPLTDRVEVLGANIVQYSVQATLTLHSGPDAAMVKTHAMRALLGYVNQQHRLNQAVNLSGVYAALHQPGVSDVELISPTENLSPKPDTAYFCTGVDIQ